MLWRPLGPGGAMQASGHDWQDGEPKVTRQQELEECYRRVSFIFWATSSGEALTGTSQESVTPDTYLLLDGGRRTGPTLWR